MVESRRSAKEEDEFFVDYVNGRVGKLVSLVMDRIHLRIPLIIHRDAFYPWIKLLYPWI